MRRLYGNPFGIDKGIGCDRAAGGPGRIEIGNNSYFWAELTDREATLFHSTLGMCTPAAFGLAMALPQRKVLALDSDGNLILNLGVLGTIANENPTNLTVLVMDNGNYLGSHKKEPGMRTATGGKMKLQEVAKGSGIASAHLIQDVATFREKIQMALKNDGPHFICAQVEALDPRDRPKLSTCSIRARTSTNSQNISRERKACRFSAAA